MLCTCIGVKIASFQTAEASKSSCDKFVNEVYRPITIVDDTRWGIVALGGMSINALVVFCIIDINMQSFVEPDFVFEVS